MAPAFSLMRNELNDNINRPTASLVILADEHPEWRPCRFDSSLWGCKTVLEFPVVKLRDFESDWHALESSTNPFSVVVMAHLKTMATGDNPSNRLEWKFRLVKMLYQRGYSRRDVIELSRFIDWLMVLPEELEKSFTEAVFSYEEAIKMPYVTSFERRGMEKGEQKGRLEGRVEMSREALFDVFEVRFDSPAPASIRELIDKVEDVSVLRALLKRVVTASSPDEFRMVLEKMTLP